MWMDLAFLLLVVITWTIQTFTNSDKLNNYSDEDFPISGFSSMLCNTYSSFERVTSQSMALEIKNSVLDSLLIEKQKNIDIYKSSSILTFTCSKIQTHAPGTLSFGGEMSLFVNILFKHQGQWRQTIIKSLFNSGAIQTFVDKW